MIFKVFFFLNSSIYLSFIFSHLVILVLQLISVICQGNICNNFQTSDFLSLNSILFQIYFDQRKLFWIISALVNNNTEMILQYLQYFDL